MVVGDPNKTKEKETSEIPNGHLVRVHFHFGLNKVIVEFIVTAVRERRTIPEKETLYWCIPHTTRRSVVALSVPHTHLLGGRGMRAKQESIMVPSHALCFCFFLFLLVL